MKLKKKLISVVCMLLMVTLGSTVFAVSSENYEADVDVQVSTSKMRVVTEQLPFEFEIVSSDANAIIVRFNSSVKINDSPYIGVSGTKLEAEKISATEYILEYCNEYSFVCSFMESGNQIVYNATLVVGEDVTDGINIVNTVVNIVPSTQPRAAGTISESEPNNDFDFADITYNDYDSNGYISTFDDVDYWVVSFDAAGSANFWLGNIPADCDYDIYVYDSNEEFINVSQNNGTAQELVTFDVEANQNYYIVVDGYMTYDAANPYLLRAKVYPHYTWPTVSRRVTQYYSSSHEAIDIGPVTQGKPDDPVYAFAAGNIYRYDFNELAGFTARINHPIDGIYYGAKYEHLSDPATVSGITTNGPVSNGEIIGKMNTTGSSSTGVHLHFEIRQKKDAYTESSGWYAGTSVNPAVFFPDILTATNSISQSGYYFDSDPTATENIFTEAVYINHNGQKFDVRWIAGMSENEREMYNITDSIIEEALMAVAGNSAYTEIEMKLADIK